MRELGIAFASASLAFVFFLLGQAFLSAFARGRQHYNALVRVERLLNMQLDEMQIVIWQLPKQKAEAEAGRLLLDMPRPITTDPWAPADLLDIGLVNRLFGGVMFLRRANNDIENLREVNEQLRGRYMDKSLSPEGYKQNMRVVVSGLEAVAQGFVSCRSEAQETLARVRVRLSQSRPLAFRVINALTSRLMISVGDLDAEALASELGKVKEEEVDVGARSRERIGREGGHRGREG